MIPAFEHSVGQKPSWQPFILASQNLIRVTNFRGPIVEHHGLTFRDDKHRLTGDFCRLGTELWISHSVRVPQSCVCYCIAVLIVTVSSANVAMAVTQTVTFQNGANGYTGTFDRKIEDRGGTFDFDGSTVPHYFFDGFVRTDTSLSRCRGADSVWQYHWQWSRASTHWGNDSRCTAFFNDQPCR